MTSTMDTPPVAPDRVHRVRNVVLAGLALLLVYAALSFVNDPRGTLSTDVGGKVATLKVMESAGSATPDVGYWAGEWDPTATYHGLYYTAVVDGKYVNVTTVPVLELARPLFAAGGYRAALLWSMLGAVAAAFAARALAQRAGGDARRAWLAFWLTGLASPVLLYALDLWEHAPGLGLMAWGVVAMVDVAASRSRWLALLAGLAFGAAFSMRTEAVAYGFVVVGIGCLLLWRRRGLVAAVVAGALAGVGFVAMALANYLLEVALLGASLRAERASGTAAVGGSDMGVRAREALTTTVGLFPSTETGRLVVGLLAVLLLGWAVWRCARPGDRGAARLAAVGVVVLFAIRAVDGLGFVPGLAATTPFAVAGAVLALDRRVTTAGRDAVLMALASLPVVWVFQYSGGAVPQWGGRYVLTSGLVLAAVGVGASWLIDRWMQFLLVGLSAAVAVFGLVWMSYRTHEIGRAAATVGAIDVPVVSIQDFWLRELGSRYDEGSRWLSLTGAGQLPEGMAILDQAGEDSFVLLWIPEGSEAAPPDIPGWAAGEDRTETWLDVDFHLTRYQRQESNVRS
jgi:hypothetical protein